MDKLFSGKVRDIYEVNDERLVIVTTDRISSFDVILPKLVKDKGKMLNEISLFWFNHTKDIVQNHILSDKITDMPVAFQKEEFEGRTVLVRKLNILPYEFVVRGYIFGNMWSAYQKKEKFCGLELSGDYQQAQRLEVPVLTPAIKMNNDHDVYVSINDINKSIGVKTTEKIKDICFRLYKRCYEYAYNRGIIIADTKFEFGLDSDRNLILADEIFTPDSSRFWSLEDYQIGRSPKSYDKQFLRDWLLNNKLGGEMQFDKIPDKVINDTARIYRECRDKIIGLNK